MSNSGGNSGVPFLYSINRRVFLAQSAAVAASTLLPSCGGGGNSNSPTPNPNPNPTSLSLVSISPTNPTALNPITVQLSGFDSTKPFTVAFSGQPQTPIRFQSDGTVVIAAPVHIDASAGATASFSTTLTITQNGSTVSSPIVINDLPQLSDLGVSLGVMSRAFLIYQEIVLGQSINAQQAISLLPNAPSSNGTLLANLQNQLLNVIRARNDIDRIVSDNSVSIQVGSAPDGTPISFDINSVTMMDRLFAQYLLATTNNGTVLPQVKYSGSRRHGNRRKRVEEPHPLAAPPSGFAQTIAGLISTVSGGVSYLSNQQTQTSTPAPTTLDSRLSSISAGAGYLSAGGTVGTFGRRQPSSTGDTCGRCCGSRTYRWTGLRRSFHGQ